MFNKIILVGNLTRDIELKYTSGSNTALAKTAIATSRKFTSNGEKKEEVCFVDITFFGRSAEIANQYLRKGSKCLVEGRLMFEQWTDQQGQKRSKHSVTVESMQMLDSKSDSQNTGGYNTPVQDNQGMTQSFGGSESYQGNQQQAPQQQQNNYNAPQQAQTEQSVYQGGQQQQNSYNAPSSQPNYQPQTTIPEIDIDEDEIPF